MKRIFISPLYEAAKISKLAQATEQAAFELTEFIDFIQYHNPGADRTAAMTAAFCLKDLRTAFLEEPEMMQQLSATLSMKKEVSTMSEWHF